MIIAFMIGVTFALCAIFFVLGAINRSRVISLVRSISFLLHYPFLIATIRNQRYSADWYKGVPLLWAHAGGGYPVLYGNTKENFDEAIKNGFRCLELDVGVTSDGVPVLTHLFRPNFENLYDGTPSLEVFNATKIDDKYTPLTLKSFIERYHDFDGFFFVDGLSFGKKSSFDVRSFFQDVDDEFKKKIIVQVFKFSDLLALKRENPFGGIHFSGIFGIGTNRFLRPLLIKALQACDVHSVSLSDFEIKGDISAMIKDFGEAQIVTSVAGVNTISYYKRLRDNGVTCVDTDYLTPEKVRNVV